MIAFCVNHFYDFCNRKSGRENFCPAESFLNLLARIGKLHQNLSEKTAKAG